MSNNRKHIRVAYEKPVELIAEELTLVGKSIDISNSGIQIVVNVPASDISVEKIALTLPVNVGYGSHSLQNREKQQK